MLMAEVAQRANLGTGDERVTPRPRPRREPQENSGEACMPRA